MSYRPRQGFFAALGTTAVGEYWFVELNTRKQPASALLHARTGWANERFEVGLFGRNLLEKHYYANAMELGPSGGFVVTPGDPATFGLIASVRF